MRCSAVGTLFIALILATPGAFSREQPHRSLLLRIDNVTLPELEKVGLLFNVDYALQTVISLVRDTAYVLATNAEREVLRERGFRCATVLADTSELTLVKRALYGPTMRLPTPYHTYASLLRELDSLAARHPHHLRLTPIGRTTQEKRAIYAAVIARSVSEESDFPAILINGCHHGDEILGAEICLAFVRELLERYGVDTAITRWVNSYRIFVVPVVNVDGYEVVTSGRDPRWRKNTRDTNGNGVLYEFTEGVDLNRNYDFNWAHGGSGDPASERYRGPYPFSESETIAIARLSRENHFLLSVTYHSQGEVIYYPWVWGERHAPDDRLLTEMARGLAGSIRTMRGDTCYKAEYGAGLVGQTYPWFYGSEGTFDFVVETGNGAAILPPGEVAGVVKANLTGLHFMLDRGGGPGLTGHIKDAATGKPLEAVVWIPSLETEDVHRRMSERKFGRFWRFLSPGTYTIIFSKPGYATEVREGVEVMSGGWTTLEVTLKADRKP